MHEKTFQIFQIELLDFNFENEIFMEGSFNGCFDNMMAFLVQSLDWNFIEYIAFELKKMLKFLVKDYLRILIGGEGFSRIKTNLLKIY